MNSSPPFKALGIICGIEQNIILMVNSTRIHSFWCYHLIAGPGKIPETQPNSSC
nr:hypothetical protein [uncultured bacterium]